MRAFLPFALLIIAAPQLAQAACTQADARARMDSLNALAERIPRNTPLYNQLMQGTMQVMQQPQITEATCAQLDALILQARR